MAAVERVVIVDLENRVVGAVGRRAMRAGVLLHRAVFVLVYDGSGGLFLQQRSAAKDLYPGCYDLSAGGVVLAGESYPAAAARELAEELGIAGVALAWLGDYLYQGPENRAWGRVYRCTHDGPLTLQALEVAGGGFHAPGEVARLLRLAPFTGDGLFLLRALGLGGGAVAEDGDNRFYPAAGAEERGLGTTCNYGGYMD